MLVETREEIRTEKHTEKTRLDSLFHTASIRFALIASLLYLLVSYVLIGFKGDQLFLVALFNCLYFASRTTRRFILAFSIFIVYWIIFDYMKAFPNYRYNEVHIASLYQLEKSLFGISWGNTVITPNEYFSLHTTAYLDLMSGFFYLCWVPVPLAFAGILFFKNRALFFRFSLTFFLVNILGFIGYYVCPAAPPWYVAQYGFEFLPSTPGNTAGLERFDALVGLPVFRGLYAKSSNVFAAMPSLHAAYMLIVLFFGLHMKLRWWNVLFATITAGIWFAAVYSGHHYILDILAGMVCAVLGITLFQWWSGSRYGKHTLDTLIKITSK